MFQFFFVILKLDTNSYFIKMEKFVRIRPYNISTNSVSCASIISVIIDLRPVAHIKRLQFRCLTMEPSFNFIENFKVWTKEVINVRLPLGISKSADLKISKSANKVINVPLPLGISKSGYPKISTTNSLNANIHWVSANLKFSMTVCDIDDKQKFNTQVMLTNIKLN